MKSLFRTIKIRIQNALYTGKDAEMHFEEGVSNVALGIDYHKLEKMPGHQLARWQSKFAPGTPQYILATEEWQNRRLAKQIKSAYYVAGISIIGTLAGVALGWYLAPSHEQIPQMITNENGAYRENTNRKNAHPEIKQNSNQAPSPVIIPPPPNTAPPTVDRAGKEPQSKTNGDAGVNGAHSKDPSAK